MTTSTAASRPTPPALPGQALSSPWAEPAVLVLGPVAVRDAAGAEARLGGALPRRLLAALAVHAGELVPADRLADFVWGEQPPRSARANLHTYLWSLRNALAAAGGPGIIGARPGGYVLRPAAGALDWHLFRDLAARAAGMADADPAAASGLLRRALALWRGPAAADLDGGPPAIAARIAAMEEARLVALGQRIDADLAAGNHYHLVPELAELTAAHPLRENLRAAQITALYRSGRQADALAAYHELRHHLAAELGIDPSPPLRDLQQAILRGDPGLDWPGPHVGGIGNASLERPGIRHLTVSAGSYSSPACPDRPDQPAPQAPPGKAGSSRPAAGTGGGQACPPGDAALGMHADGTLGQRGTAMEARLFQGRRAELRQLLGMMDTLGRVPRIVQLHGPAGIGKTAFAYTLAGACAARGWPAIILDSRDFSHDNAGLTAALAARCSERWSPGCGRPLLLVLDTVEEMGDIERDLWDCILPGVRGPVLVVLSGRRPTPIFARPAQWTGLVNEVALPGLAEAEARRLILLHGVRDPQTTSEILAFANGNPLLLTMAAQHAKTAGTGDLAISGPVARSLIGRMTCEVADPSVRQQLEAASLVRTFNQELLAAMIGHDVSGSFGALCELSVVRAVPAGWRLHDVVRDSVATDFRWREPEACHQMRQRACRYLSQQAPQAVDPGPYIQELLHLTTTLSARARFYAPADHHDVHVRPVDQEDLPGLTELCHTGITRFGIPPEERARQLRADFPAARTQFGVALNAAGAMTGFAYTVPLNRATWRIAARTREPFFAALPEPELADIMATPATASHINIVTGATYLPGYDHVGEALKGALFPQALKRHALSGPYLAYHLLTRDCLDVLMNTAGLARRREGIRLDGWQADEWLLRFGDAGFIGWIGEVLGAAQRPG